MQKYVEVKPCSLPDHGECAVWLKVGNQSFQLAGEFPKEDAEWMKGMLVKALDHIYSDSRAIEEERDALRADNKLLELYLSNTRKDKEVLAADVSDLNASRDDVIQANKALTADLHAAREQITHLLEDSDGLAKLYAEADGKLAKAREALVEIRDGCNKNYLGNPAISQEEVREIAKAALKAGEEGEG